MKILQSVQKQNNLKGDAVFFGLFEGKNWPENLVELDKSLGGVLKKISSKEKFKGSEGTNLSYTFVEGIHVKRVVVLGLGKLEECSGDYLQNFGAKVVSMANGSKADRATLVCPVKGDEDVLYHLALGAHLADYKFDKYTKKNKDKSKHQLGQLEVSPFANEAATAKTKASLKRAEIVAEATSHARDLTNEPGATITPIALAADAKRIAKKRGLKIKVLDEKQIAKEKMFLYLSVSAGSTKNPARFIHLTYTPKAKNKSGRKIFLVGKGVTFDSGGLSLKPAKGMMDMKIDMSGSAAVLGIMEAVSRIGSEHEVHALIAATENMPDGNATRPGDIVTSRSGKSVEILNTDAEGRLTLADALTYAQDHGATEMIDFATLTGACVVALGLQTAGLFSNDDKLANNLLQSFEKEGEDLWRLPLTKSLKKDIKSSVADLKNIGGSWGGAITAALFLEAFVEKTPWAHIDLAGPASSEENGAYIKKGGRGFAVSSLVDYLCL